MLGRFKVPALLLEYLLVCVFVNLLAFVHAYAAIPLLYNLSLVWVKNKFVILSPQILCLRARIVSKGLWALGISKLIVLNYLCQGFQSCFILLNSSVRQILVRAEKLRLSFSCVGRKFLVVVILNYFEIVRLKGLRQLKSFVFVWRRMMSLPLDACV